MHAIKYFILYDRQWKSATSCQRNLLGIDDINDDIKQLTSNTWARAEMHRLKQANYDGPNFLPLEYGYYRSARTWAKWSTPELILVSVAQSNFVHRRLYQQQFHADCLNTSSLHIWRQRSIPDYSTCLHEKKENKKKNNDGFLFSVSTIQEW